MARHIRPNPYRTADGPIWCDTCGRFPASGHFYTTDAAEQDVTIYYCKACSEREPLELVQVFFLRKDMGH